MPAGAQPDMGRPGTRPDGASMAAEDNADVMRRYLTEVVKAGDLS
jgi:hypothetical protein